MKKFTKVLLSLALVASMVVPAALTASAAELTVKDGGSANTGCGFLDGNLDVTESFKAANTSELTVTVNGNTAYFNNGYLGQVHCNLGTNGDGVEKGWLQIGVVGADVVPGTNTMVVTDKEGNTATLNFESTINALGTSYAKVVYDAKAKSLKAEIVFNTDPKLPVDTTLNGWVHDEHNDREASKTAFAVTAYDPATKMYTIESKEEFTTTHSLLELQITSEGAYKGFWISATINKGDAFKANKTVSGEQIELINATAVKTGTTDKFGSAANLINGTSNPKLEGSWPSEGVTVTVEAKEAAKAATLVLYTQDDGSWGDRAPKTFKVYGSNTAGELGDEIASVEDAQIENVNDTPFAFALNAAQAYKYYTIVVSAGKGGYFQIGEVELYTGNVTITDGVAYVTKTGIVAYNGTEPECPHANTELQGAKQPTDTDKGYTGDLVCTDCGETIRAGEDIPASGIVGGDGTDEDPVPTGDSVIALVVLSVVSLLGVAVISKKRV